MDGLHTEPDNAGPEDATQTLFFYGSLCHQPLLERVLGRRILATDITETSLSGHKAYWVKGKAYPVILPCDGEKAHGLAVANLSVEDRENLDFYEGGFSYKTQLVTLESGQKALVFFANDTSLKRGTPWILADWVRQYGQMALFAADEIMSYRDQFSVKDVSDRFNVIQMRAWTKVLAQRPQAEGPGFAMGREDIKVLRAGRPFNEFFAMDDLDVQFRKFSGEFSDVARRFIFKGTDAVIVLPYDPVRDRVLLVEQVRFGTYQRGADVNWTIEPVAGLIDPGESPEDAAKRETQEEANVSLTKLIHTGSYYPSPGATTEYYHSYLGLCDLPDDVCGVSGVEEENEDIRSYLVSYQELMDLIDRKVGQVGPLYVLALWLARHRDSLRRNA
ncbi:MAG: NUDIX domain-containing protein [Pseudoruegeria sp.]